MKKSLITLLFFLVFYTFAQAQNWIYMPGADDGEASVEHATIVNNKLYVEGIFDSIGYVNVPGFAVWDGIKWDSVCRRTKARNAFLDFMAMCEYKGELYVALSLENNKGHYGCIKKWNGKGWDSIASTNVDEGKVYGHCKSGWNSAHFAMLIVPLVEKLYVFNGDLYVAGRFKSIGGTKANNIARWDGKKWHRLGEGIDDADVVGENAMCEYNGKLYVAGSFDKVNGKKANNIGCWNGEDWENINPPNTNHYEALAVYNNELFAGAYFTDPVGDFKTGLMSWDGKEWKDIGTGSPAIVNNMAVYNGELYASWDRMTKIDTFYSLGRWNGSRWATLGKGINHPHTIDSLGFTHREYVVSRKVNSLIVYKDALYVFGMFYTIGDMKSYSVGKWVMNKKE